jgi:hypothetical protein
MTWKGLSAEGEKRACDTLVQAVDGGPLSIHSIATIAPESLGYSINQNFYLLYSVQ